MSGRIRLESLHPTSRVFAHALWLSLLLSLVGCSRVDLPETAGFPTGGPSRVRSFVLSNVYIVADPGGAQSCPMMSQTSLEILARSLPPKVLAEVEKLGGEQKIKRLSEERARRLGFKLARLEGGSPPTAEQLEQKRRELGIPSGKGGLTFLGRVFSYDSCTDPQDFPSLRGGLRFYEGRVAQGINLDGRTGATDYTGPGGEPGVDNELWRIVGCARIFRESGDSQTAHKTLFSARAPTLIELSNVDDMNNDPDVAVAIYSSADPLVVNATGGVLAHASYDIDPDPTLQSITRGRIVDGLLTTEPFDLTLNYKEQIVETKRLIRGARVQAKVIQDGSIQGGIYGYYDVESFWRSVQGMSQLGADFSGFSCPDVWEAVHRLADGFPDPKTGRNTAISSTLQFVGMPAYVTHQPSDVPLARGGRETT